jgi:hypothetical protein
MPGDNKNLLVDILKTASHKEECVNQVFKTVLREAEEKVKRRLSEGGTSLVFEFPIMKAGLPAYDVVACSHYVIKRLHSRGLDAELLDGRSLRISWDRLLKEARRQKYAKVLAEHRERKAARDRRRAEKRNKERASSGGSGPPLPPHADDPNDLFSLPSVRSLKTMADELRHV